MNKKLLFVNGKRGNLAVCKNGHTMLDDESIQNVLFVLAPCGHYVCDKDNYCNKCGTNVKEYLLCILTNREFFEPHELWFKKYLIFIKLYIIFTI